MIEKQKLIRNVRRIDPLTGRADACDVLFARTKSGSAIRAIGKNLRVEQTDGQTVINAHGQSACPPFTDLRCCLPDPGFSYRESMSSGLLAAQAGGFGQVLLMPVTKPLCDTPASVAAIKSSAKNLSDSRVFLCAPQSRGGLGRTLCNFEELKNAGISAVCPDYEEGDESAAFTLDALRACARLDLLYIASCRKHSIHRRGAVNDGRMAEYLNAAGVEALGELLALTDSITLCKYTNCRLHFPLVTLAESVALLRRAKSEGVPITCGTAPFYFSFSEEELFFSGVRAKLDPPLRAERDRLAVIEGLRDGTIDCIVSDHTPLSEDEKSGGFKGALPGAVGLETAFAAGITHLVLPGHLSQAELIALLSVKPARILGVERPFAVGSPFDLLFFDADAELIYGKNTLRSRSSNTPFFGRALHGRVTALYLDGIKQF